MRPSLCFSETLQAYSRILYTENCWNCFLDHHIVPRRICLSRECWQVQRDCHFKILPLTYMKMMSWWAISFRRGLSVKDKSSYRLTVEKAAAEMPSDHRKSLSFVQFFSLAHSTLGHPTGSPAFCISPQCSFLLQASPTCSTLSKGPATGYHNQFCSPV